MNGIYSTSNLSVTRQMQAECTFSNPAPSYVHLVHAKWKPRHIINTLTQSDQQYHDMHCLCWPTGNQTFASTELHRTINCSLLHETFPSLPFSLNTRQGRKNYAGNFLACSVPLSQPLIYTAWTESAETLTFLFPTVFTIS